MLKGKQCRVKNEPNVLYYIVSDVMQKKSESISKDLDYMICVMDRDGELYVVNIEEITVLNTVL